MNTKEDFDFACLLSVNEALNRLKQHTAPAGNGTFYGTVNGNHFDLQHDVGVANNSGDDPRVTGYIVPEGTGCRVFARTQAPSLHEYDANMGLILLVFMVVLIAYIFWDDQGNSFQNQADGLPEIALQILFLAGIAFGGWRYLVKFKKTGKFDTISQFKNTLQ